MSFKRPKWPIRPTRDYILKCCLVFEKQQTKINKCNKAKKQIE